MAESRRWFSWIFRTAAIGLTIVVLGAAVLFFLPEGPAAFGIKPGMTYEQVCDHLQAKTHREYDELILMSKGQRFGICEPRHPLAGSARRAKIREWVVADSILYVAFEEGDIVIAANDTRESRLSWIVGEAQKWNPFR